MRDVRDAPALPNELRAAMVMWLPEMSAGLLTSISPFWHSGSWAIAVRELRR